MTPLNTGWHRALVELTSSAREQLTIAAPFITAPAVRSITTVIHPTLRDRGKMEIITDLSPAHVCDGALEPAAVQHLMAATRHPNLYHIRRFHAKIYIADNARAIVTSGNLTSGGFYRNVEYGFEVRDQDIVATIASDLAVIREFGVPVGVDQLAGYVEAANQVVTTFRRQQTVADPLLRQAFLRAVQTAEDDLVRLRLAGGGMHTVFAKTILFVLGKYGPLRTEAIHEHIQRLHPDLCDDSVDRVIDGHHYGKKWKHAVRTAQQWNKRRGHIRNEGTLWSIDPSPSANVAQR
ncbi:MAG TPA: phospholipase D-like domain-containing protein [Chthonomonadaceae bacterium]|nr:phospholipase D-like domain-containing protein [Chthonomonadaceae bacterium]